MVAYKFFALKSLLIKIVKTIFLLMNILIEPKSAFKANLKNEMNEISQKHERELCKLSSSFAEEIEELHETIGSLSSQLNLFVNEKNYHGQKFIEILDKAKAKNQIVKNENKRLTKKLDKLQLEFDKLTDSYTQLVNNKAELEEWKRKYDLYIEKLENESKELKRKLFKFEADDDVINLDPYELHRKIRYYESQMDYNDKEFLKVRKEHNQIMNYLNLLGITKEDLRISWATGVMQFQNFNSKWFELNYKNKSSPKKKQLRPRKSISWNKDEGVATWRRLPAEKYDEMRRMLNSSKTKNYDVSMDDALDLDTLSLSSESNKTNNASSFAINIERQTSNIRSIGDFVKSKQSSNLEILKYLNKTKEADEFWFQENCRENDSGRESFDMISRKRGYEEKIKKSRLWPDFN